jgi:hypothetical protein
MDQAPVRGSPAVMIVIVIIIASLHKRETMGAIQAGNDWCQLAEIKIQPSDKAGRDTGRVRSADSRGISSARDELRFCE